MEQCRGQPANHDPFHKRISGKPLRLQIEATFGSIEHRLCGLASSQVRAGKQQNDKQIWIDDGWLPLEQRKDMVMNKQTITIAVAGAIIAGVVVASVPASWAAPVSSSVAAFKQATLSDVTDVYYRGYYGRRYYPGAAIGLGILGAAAGAAAIRSGYYGPGYGYYGPGYGYYGPGYGYYGNPYPYRRRYYYSY
jgi:hypothetical protein